MAFLSGALGHFLTVQYLWDNGSVNSQAITRTHTIRSFDSLVIYEGIFIDGLYDKLERYLGGQSVAVLDHRFSIWTIPTVHCRKKQEK